MPEITATMVKALRDATNVSMMECKRALVEAGGDADQATKLLRERGVAVAAKRATRAANQGIIAAAEANGGKIKALVEVNCETDFVTRNEGFQAFVVDMAGKAVETDANLAETLEGEVTAKRVEIGENITLRRNTRFVLDGNGLVGSYIHLGGKVGVLVDVGCEKADTVDADAFKTLVSDLTLHVAAVAPQHLNSDDVPADLIASERDIYAQQVKDKPAQIIDKIVDGKIKKFLGEICLVDQGFVKEPKQSITDLLAETGKALDDTLTIRRFVRYQLGV
jgi:elongation factor Ts